MSTTDDFDPFISALLAGTPGESKDQNMTSLKNKPTARQPGNAPLAWAPSNGDFPCT